MCNLNCIYCGNEPNPYGEPKDISYSIETLKQFLSQDKKPIIAFYGGEPLIAEHIIEEVIDNIPAYKYVLQTNGLLIRKLPGDYIKKLDAILVSIDGDRFTTDYYRGKGVYDAVINNVHYLREIGYDGDIIARMTISGNSDIYRDVLHLINLRLFDHIHWQLDVFFDAPPRRYSNFDEWLKYYEKGIKKLVDLWIENLKKGHVIGLVPFQGIIKIIKEGAKGKLPCGAGIDAFSISTSGKIFACPISPSEEFYLGDIRNTSIEEVVGKITIGEPCIHCDYFDICGGRCLYANKTMLWGEKMFYKVCEATKYTIDILREALVVIDNLVVDGTITWKKVIYPEYNNTTEIIP